MRIGESMEMGSLVGKMHGRKQTWKRRLRIIKRIGAAFDTVTRL
jgi:hypothetical protein